VSNGNAVYKPCQAGEHSHALARNAPEEFSIPLFSSDLNAFLVLTLKARLTIIPFTL
jgi:hypothetical protein